MFRMLSVQPHDKKLKGFIRLKNGGSAFIAFSVQRYKDLHTGLWIATKTAKQRYGPARVARYRRYKETLRR